MCFRPTAVGGAAESMKCPKCGAEVFGGADRCPSCGATADSLGTGAAGMATAPAAPGMPAAPGAPMAPGAPATPGAPVIPKAPGA